MAKGWYVVHTFTGHENKVEKFIRIKMDEGVFNGAISDVKVPSEEVSEVRNGKKRSVKKRFLPGYILVEMDLPEQGWKIPCGEIRRINGVTGFVGTSSSNSKPQPISAEEAKSILQKTGAIKTERKVHARQDYQVGEEIKIIDGPFESFKGTVEAVNQEKGKLQVTVGIFGRATPVELSFSQVDRE